MKLFTIVAATTLLSTQVLAADAISYNEPAPPVVADTFSWTGGYVGINAGYAFGKAKSNVYEEDFDEESTFTYDYNESANGFIGGVQAGYNWQMNKLVLGVETDIQASYLEAKLNYSDYGVKVATKIDWFGTTRARIGFTPLDRLMVYATGGIAYGKINQEMWSGYVSKSETRVGYTVGAGAEYALNNHLTLKSEYLYTDLGKMKIDQRDDYYSENGTVKLPFHTIRIGVNYKF